MGVRNLIHAIVYDFVMEIIVYTRDKSSGYRRQKVELVWKFIGEVNLLGDDQTVRRK